LGAQHATAFWTAWNGHEVFFGETVDDLNAIRRRVRDEDAACGAVDIAMVEFSRPLASWGR
jgi:hypothetical protein